MQVNYGSTINIIRAIKEWGQQKYTKLVYIGTVAETGDRMPPIHWGRVGDPLKPSVYDYYAVSKIAAERAVVESGLRYWVSLRQTGIMSRNMVKIRDGIMFHNGIENVLEYVSNRDSGIILKNVCGNLPETFWNHIYNIGGGETCRDWNQVVPMEHGYDETKDEKKLSGEDMKADAPLDMCLLPVQGWFLKVVTGVMCVNAPPGIHTSSEKTWIIPKTVR